MLRNHVRIRFCCTHTFIHLYPTLSGSVTDRQMQPVCQESSLAQAQWARRAGGKLIFDERFMCLSYTGKLTLMVGVMLPGRDLLSRDLRVPLSPETGGWSCSWCLSSWRRERWGKAFSDVFFFYHSWCCCISMQTQRWQKEQSLFFCVQHWQSLHTPTGRQKGTLNWT